MMKAKHFSVILFMEVKYTFEQSYSLGNHNAAAEFNIIHFVK